MDTPESLLDDQLNLFLQIKNHQLKEENEQLRRLLATAYSGINLYRDDGELQDASRWPHIDLKRDSVETIVDKMYKGHKMLIKLSDIHVTYRDSGCDTDLGELLHTHNPDRYLVVWRDIKGHRFESVGWFFLNLLKTGIIQLPFHEDTPSSPSGDINERPQL